MPDVSGPIRTFGPTDKYSTGDANYQSRGIHTVKNIAEMLAITPDRRRGIFSPKGTNPNPDFWGCLVEDKGDGKTGLYLFKNEPGTAATTLADWELWTPVTVSGGIEYQDFFDPTTTTLADGTGANGNFYIANASGTFNGETYVVGDWTIYDGATWRRLPAGIAALPPSAHTHAISDITGLATALSNLVSYNDITQDVTNQPDKVPSSNAILTWWNTVKANVITFSENITFSKAWIAAWVGTITEDRVVMINASDKKANAVTTKTAFNKDFGTTAGTVAEGSSIITENSIDFYTPDASVHDIFGSNPLTIKQAFDALAVYARDNAGTTTPPGTIGYTSTYQSTYTAE